jgi:hypothetical protein
VDNTPGVTMGKTGGSAQEDESMFIPGLELCRRFYDDVVRAFLEHVPHTAARIGKGSEVLGFDTERSADHDWGPRLQVFLRPDDERGPEISEALSAGLPKTFLGYPTNFSGADDDGVRVMQATDGPVEHRIDVTSLDVWIGEVLGFDPRVTVTTRNWLAIPTQVLAEVTSGAVFHDGLGELGPVRQRLAWYPDDIWRYVLASQWSRLSEEEAFVGRCGEAGDELGSAVVAARQVRDLMRLCLLMHRRYPPYNKWLGSAFARLPLAAKVTPMLTGTLAATTWHERENHLATAYTAIAVAHNDLGLTDPVDPSTRPYHTRPFQVLHAERFTQALLDTIPHLGHLPLTGAIDQFADNTDLLDNRDLTSSLVEVALSAG